MAPENWTAIAIAVLSMLGSGYTVMASRKKQDADAASTLTGAALKW